MSAVYFDVVVLVFLFVLFFKCEIKPTIQEADVVGSLWVQGQPGIQSETKHGILMISLTSFRVPVMTHFWICPGEGLQGDLTEEGRLFLFYMGSVIIRLVSWQNKKEESKKQKITHIASCDKAHSLPYHNELYPQTVNQQETFLKLLLLGISVRERRNS